MPKRIFRWLLVLILLAGAAKLFRFGVTLPIGPGAFVVFVGMFFCLILAACLLVPDALPVVTRPFTAFIDGIYGTGPGKGRPPLDYGLARGYKRQRRNEEALQEYGRIMRLYPREAEPYSESIVLLLHETGDVEAARRVLRRGLRKIRSKDERTALKAVFEEETALLRGS